MRPTIHLIESALPKRLSIVARPRGGDWLCDEVDALSREGIHAVVSMLTEEEAIDLGLRDEGSECRKHQIAFVNVPIPDRSVPSDRERFVDAVDQVAQELQDGKSVAIHCRAGIGRSALFAASVLVRLGWDAAAAFAAIRKARGCDVPDTPEQRNWVEQNVVWNPKQR